MAAEPAPRAAAASLPLSPAPAAVERAALPPATNQDRRRAEAARVRNEVRTGISRVEAELEQEAGKDERRLEQCRQRLEALVSLAAAHQPELADELARTRGLEGRIATLQVEARTAAQEDALTRAAWERRIGEIERLIGDRSYPEARRLAEGLTAEAGVPAEVAVRARELAARADRELKRIFGAGHFGAESHQVREKPPS
jgi:hypothetical protein